jgi:hypothetical protein
LLHDDSSLYLRLLPKANLEGLVLPKDEDFPKLERVFDACIAWGSNALT